MSGKDDIPFSSELIPMNSNDCSSDSSTTEHEGGGGQAMWNDIPFGSEYVGPSSD